MSGVTSGMQKEASEPIAILITQPGSGCRGWFCCQSVASIFAGFRSWKFGRARSAEPAEGRAAGQSNTRFTGCFQPGTFLMGCIHPEAFYQKIMAAAKYLIGRTNSCEPANPKRRYRGLRPRALGFLPILM